MYEELDKIEFKSEDNVEKAIQVKELKYEIDTLLNTLTTKDREIFIRYYINEEIIRDIAEDINMKQEVIYNRLSRGKKRIKSIFGSR